MNKIILVAITIFLFTSFVAAQVPAGMKYQAILRDGAGNILPNQSINLRATVIDSAAGGNAAFVEVHKPATNQFGLFSITLGDGAVLSGVLENVDWPSGNKWLQLEVDITGGTNWSPFGISRLQSVPYALFANEAANVDDADSDPTNELQDISLSGTNLSISSGSTVDLSVVQDGVDDADNDPTNEIQTLSLAGNSLSISGGNSITLPSGTVNTDDQTLSLSGTTLSIEDGNSVSLDSLVGDNDWTVSDTHIYNSNSGYVGIGTIMPQELLHVAGNILINHDTYLRGFNLFGEVVNIIGVSANDYIEIGSPSVGIFEEVRIYQPQGLNTGVRIMNSADPVAEPTAFFREDGYVGLGTHAPDQKLHVRKGNIKIDNGYFIRGVTSVQANVDLIGINTSNIIEIGKSNSSTLNELKIYHPNGINTGLRIIPNGSNTTTAFFRQDGNVGIGTDMPDEKLHVVGNICYTGIIGSCSDARYKRDVAPLTASLEKVLQLQGVSYYWKTEAYTGKKFSEEKQIGFIAQAIEKIYPEMVLTNSEGYKSVDYSRLTPVLVEAIKEQQAQMDALKTENRSLKERLGRIEALLID